MPIYEFYSPQTGRIYTFFARSQKYSKETPLCPDGEKYSMKKVLSGFSITGRSSESEEMDDLESETKGDPFDDLPPEKANSFMKELESAMHGMDENNPDPRQMGSLMRRMSELTGEKMDEPMEEVVRKLEEGADPEALEDKMEGYVDENNESQNDQPTDNSGKMKLRINNLLKKKITRDPNLYEFSDYLSTI